MPKVTKRKAPLRRTFLRQWREYRNLSQDQAAERIGVDRSSLSKIENGRSAYNQAFLEAAAMAYLCEPADLLIRNPQDDSAPWSILDALQRAPKERRAQIIAVVDTLLKTGS